MSNLVAYLNRTPTSEKYLFLVWFQEECQKDMYSKKKMRSCVQNVITILGSIINIMRGRGLQMTI